MTDNQAARTTLQPQKAGAPSDDVRQELASIIRDLPTSSPIFLPTERIPLEEQLVGLRRVKEIYASRFDQRYKPRLQGLKQKYAGNERCFVIGNGPSLNATDLSVLRNEVTFAVNGFFLKARELDWQPTFYVVEDHLVAEDRRSQLNKLAGSTKLYPIYLAYCLDEAEDTIFYNHRPRKSYPHGFDFSTDAAEITYTGCTVTFSCLQLAHYFGFKEIYLIGVDADYDLPSDVDVQKQYGVGVLDMKSDDPNHFHPDYFGKGFRWHDPQVDKMLEAYAEAKRVTDRTGRSIFNAGIGGKLEIFERRSFHDIFPNAQSSERMLAKSNAARTHASNEIPTTPRLLVIDHTRIGDGTATGELKANLFANWSGEKLLQIYEAGAGKLGVLQEGATETFDCKDAARLNSAFTKRVSAFAPEVILYRPVPNSPHLHEAAMRLVEQLDIPLVTWIMDDWPMSPDFQKMPGFDQVMRDWPRLLKRADKRFSISREMSEAFEARYGVPFEAFANGVDPAEWQPRDLRSGQPFVVRYAGSLAENMTLDAVCLVAEAVERLFREGVDIRLEIKTRPAWQRIAAQRMKQFTRTHFFVEELSPADYRSWLCDSDVSLIGYNFSPTSVDYVQYSLANKLPECLAAGAALLAVGPKEVATLRTLEQHDCGVRINHPDVEDITARLRDLIADPERRIKLGEHGRTVAFESFNIFQTRTRFMGALERAAKSRAKMNTFPRAHPRSAGASVDETAVVARLLADRRGTGHIMLDVGAHFGTSARYFRDLGWTIHCFEPDPANRKKLVSALGKSVNVTIDPRAVSDQPTKGVSFYTSDESTGISGLSAFRDTHRESGRVDVTTVAEIVAEKHLDRIDFLKIDVEGFDFAVLKGAPWDTVKPDVIECEYEDAKTLKMGHSYKDVCDFLVSKGYTVYLSEWHPIIRYGIAHDWRQVIKYPAPVADAQGWGNILAFRSDPGLDTLQTAFKACMTVRGVTRGVAAGATKNHSATRAAGAAPTHLPPGNHMSMYTRLALWAQARNPIVFRLGQFTMWCVRTAGRYPLLTLLGPLVLAVLIALGFVPELEAYAVWLWLAAAGLGLFGLFTLTLGYVGHLVKTLKDELRRQPAISAAAIEQRTTQLVKQAMETRLSAAETRIEAELKKLAAAQAQQGLAPLRRFNRRLTPEQTDKLAKQWSRTLSLSVSPNAVSYMAHRARLIEDQLQGRLATSIEDILLRTLVARSVKRPEISILEIGTLFGTGAAILYDALAPHFEKVHITLLDPLDGYYAHGQLDILTGQPVTEAMVRQNLARAGVPGECLTIVKRFSTDPEALKETGRRQYDVLIIDGDHTYSGVKADFDNYVQFVRLGGYVIFDDYGSEDWPEVKQYVDKEVADRAELGQVGHDWRTSVFRVTRTMGEHAPAPRPPANGARTDILP